MSLHEVQRLAHGAGPDAELPPQLAGSRLGAAENDVAEPRPVDRVLPVSARPVAHQEHSPAGAVAACDQEAAVGDAMDRARPRPIACGILEEMLDDRPLQRSIANREIACISATTRSVLLTKEHPR